MYDESLLTSINLLKQDWDQAQQTEQAVADVDPQVIAQTELAKQKYEFMYRQSRKRRLKNTRIQPSVYDN
ncbi:hypothetical protein FC87_GL000169 [Fructilactobacillus florum DSM 22689 = JCM 16035]|nr:hypothetical protein FC87_GL000169 [Fructilactobacillus florum DSM 22689 = JCM 16035]